MSNVIEMPPTPRFFSTQDLDARRSRVRSTADFRRLLSDMRLRPPSQRAFLRRFLKRAVMTGAPVAFPVQVPVVSP